jgi:hypothetical protein
VRGFMFELQAKVNLHTPVTGHDFQFEATE